MRIIRTFLLALLVTMLYGQSAYSEIYRWKDSSGRIHFTDKKPVEAASELIELKVNTYESVSYDKSTFAASSKVVMYSTVWCGVCKKAKRYFQKNNIFTNTPIEFNDDYFKTLWSRFKKHSKLIKENETL